MLRIRRHLTYANVVLTLLAFIVLGGNAWAIARNSVGSKQLKNKAVTAKKIRNGAVTAAKIANGAVTGADIKPTSFDLTVHQQSVSVPSGAGGTTASCPGGKKAIAGGGEISGYGYNQNARMEDSRPVTGVAGIPVQDGAFSGWRVIWSQSSVSGDAFPAKVYVVCLG